MKPARYALLGLAGALLHAVVIFIQVYSYYDQIAAGPGRENAYGLMCLGSLILGLLLAGSVFICHAVLYLLFFVAGKAWRKVTHVDLLGFVARKDGVRLNVIRFFGYLVIWRAAAFIYSVGNYRMAWSMWNGGALAGTAIMGCIHLNWLIALAKWGEVDAGD